ncbi:DUF305 domain-containing protein [Saccharomonospora iraqiensis]|uniref:DUF305 domain-containing protein n=1 Tax=Saccharomonospora iraqiensis TaxID=52698 RepID=UPI00022E4613|nr:DUF305 domain-containing protein [Saccharomonospora iraqiensis]
MTGQEEPDDTRDGSGTESDEAAHPEPEAAHPEPATAHPETAESEDAGAARTGVSGAPTWSRVVIAGALAVALLLVGATGGMLLAENRDGADTAASGTAGADPVSVGFSQDMAAHHVQAVTMSNWLRDRSDDRAVRQLAFDIGSTQQEQIGRMKGWLMLWGEPEQAVGAPMTWMSGHGDGAHGDGAQGEAGTHGDDAHADGHAPRSAGDPLMPGMATEDELARMRSLSGEELDVYFLQLMLRHHQGGVDMARYAVEHSEVRAVRMLAQSMLDVQGAEVDLMRTMLAERDAEPLPFP